MKKNVFFIVTSIVLVILAIYTIVNANQVVLEQINMFKQTSTEYSEEIISVLEKSGKNTIIIPSAVIAIINILGLRIAISDELEEKRGRMIAISVVSLLLSSNSLVMITAVVSLVALLCSKRKVNEGHQKDEKKKVPNVVNSEEEEIPNIEYQNSSLKEKILALVLVAVYGIQFCIEKIIPQNASREVIYAIIISYYVLLFIIAVICFGSTLKRDFKIFKNNAKLYFKYILPRYGLTYLIFIVFNAICLSITNQVTSANQAEVNSLPLWFLLPIAIIWAPIVEETVYRGVLRRFVKNDVFFVIVSTVVFAFVHTTSEGSIFNMIVMMVPYATLAGVFGYVYAKTNNIYTNIFLHFLQNSIASVLSVLLIITSR